MLTFAFVNAKVNTHLHMFNSQLNVGGEERLQPTSGRIIPPFAIAGTIEAHNLRNCCRGKHRRFEVISLSLKLDTPERFEVLGDAEDLESFGKVQDTDFLLKSKTPKQMLKRKKCAAPETSEKLPEKPEKPLEKPEVQRKSQHKILSTDRADIKHYKTCLNKACLRCKYLRNERAWKKRTPMITKEIKITKADVSTDKIPLLSESWLRCFVDSSGNFVAGCGPCHDSGDHSSWLAQFEPCTAASLQISNLLQHQASTTHINAVYTQFKLLLGTTGKPMTGAPSEDEIRLAWDAACQHLAARDGVQGVGGEQKIMKIWWCISEAMFQIDRAFLKESDGPLAGMP